MGVTVIVAVTGELVVLTAVKEEISPLPLAGIPIEGLLFVQVASPPNVFIKLTAAAISPLQTVRLPGWVTAGKGFTVIVNDTGVPEQLEPDIEGVTIIVAVIGKVVVLAVVNVGIPPFPLAASPIEVLLFVQL